MKVKLTHATIVRFPAGAVLEVPDKEAARLMALHNAVPAEAEQPAPKQTKAKKAKN